MHCSACSSVTHVLDTRPTGDGGICRSRECEHCGERFTTYERLDVGATELERAVVEFIRGLDATTEEMTT